MAGKEAVQRAARASDPTCGRPRLSSSCGMPRASSFGDVETLLDVVADEKEGPLLIPPVPLHALLAADKDSRYAGRSSPLAGINSMDH